MLAANAAQSVFWALSYYLVIEMPVAEERWFQSPVCLCLVLGRFFSFLTSMDKATVGHLDGTLRICASPDAHADARQRVFRCLDNKSLDNNN